MLDFADFELDHIDVARKEGEAHADSAFVIPTMR